MSGNSPNPQRPQGTRDPTESDLSVGSDDISDLVSSSPSPPRRPLPQRDAPVPSFTFNSQNTSSRDVSSLQSPQRPQPARDPTASDLSVGSDNVSALLSSSPSPPRRPPPQRDAPVPSFTFNSQNTSSRDVSSSSEPSSLSRSPSPVAELIPTEEYNQYRSQMERIIEQKSFENFPSMTQKLSEIESNYTGAEQLAWFRGWFKKSYDGIMELNQFIERLKYCLHLLSPQFEISREYNVKVLLNLLEYYISQEVNAKKMVAADYDPAELCKASAAGRIRFHNRKMREIVVDFANQDKESRERLRGLQDQIAKLDYERKLLAQQLYEIQQEIPGPSGVQQQLESSGLAPLVSENEFMERLKQETESNRILSSSLIEEISQEHNENQKLVNELNASKVKIVEVEANCMNEIAELSQQLDRVENLETSIVSMIEEKLQESPNLPSSASREFQEVVREWLSTIEEEISESAEKINSILEEAKNKDQELAQLTNTLNTQAAASAEVREKIKLVREISAINEAELAEKETQLNDAMNYISQLQNESVVLAQAATENEILVHNLSANIAQQGSEISNLMTFSPGNLMTFSPGNLLTFSPDPRIASPQLTGVTTTYDVGPQLCIQTQQTGAAHPYSQNTTIDHTLKPDGELNLSRSPLQIRQTSDIPVRSPQAPPDVEGEVEVVHTAAEDAGSSLNKTLLLHSPDTEEGLVVNIDVQPQPLRSTDEGEQHFVCDVSLNMVPTPTTASATSYDKMQPVRRRLFSGGNRSVLSEDLEESLGLLSRDNDAFGLDLSTSFGQTRSPIKKEIKKEIQQSLIESLNESLGLMEESKWNQSGLELRTPESQRNKFRRAVEAVVAARGGNESVLAEDLEESLGLLSRDNDAFGLDLSSSFGQTRSPIKKEVQQALIESLNESLGLIEESKWNQSELELRTPESPSNKFRRAVEAFVRGAEYGSPTVTTQEPVIPPISAQSPRQISPQFVTAVKQVIAQSPRQISPQVAAAINQVAAQSPRQISPQVAAAIDQVIAQSPRQISPQVAAAVKQVIAQSPRQISPQVAAAIKQVTAQSPRQISPQVAAAINQVAATSQRQMSPQVATAIKQAISQIPQQTESILLPPKGVGFVNPLKKYAAVKELSRSPLQIRQTSDIPVRSPQAPPDVEGEVEVVHTAADDAGSSLNKTLLLHSPDTEEGLVVNIDVQPQPLRSTEEGEQHFVCDVSLNMVPTPTTASATSYDKMQPVRRRLFSGGNRSVLSEDLEESLGLLSRDNDAFGLDLSTSFGQTRSPIKKEIKKEIQQSLIESLNESLGLMEESKWNQSGLELRTPESQRNKFRRAVEAVVAASGGNESVLADDLEDSLGLLSRDNDAFGLDLSSSFGPTRSPIKKEVQQALIESLNESLGLIEESKWNQSELELRTPESPSNKFRRAVEAFVRGADYVSPTVTTQESVIPPIRAQSPRQISPQFVTAVKQVIAQSPRQISSQFADAVKQVIAQSPRQISPQVAAAVKQVIAQSPRQISPQVAAAIKQVAAQSPRQMSPQVAAAIKQVAATSPRKMSPQVATAIKQAISQIPQQTESILLPPEGVGFINPLKKYAAVKELSRSPLRIRQTSDIPVRSPPAPPDVEGQVEVVHTAADVAGSSLNKTLLLHSPDTEEGLVVNIDVQPQPLRSTEEGDQHFVCDVTLNMVPTPTTAIATSYDKTQPVRRRLFSGGNQSVLSEDLEESLGLLSRDNDAFGLDLSSSFGQTRSPIKKEIKKEVQQALIESLNESLGLVEESKWNQSGFELRTPESQSNKFRRAVEAVVAASGGNRSVLAEDLNESLGLLSRDNDAFGLDLSSSFGQTRSPIKKEIKKEVQQALIESLNESLGLVEESKWNQSGFELRTPESQSNKFRRAVEAVVAASGGNRSVLAEDLNESLGLLSRDNDAFGLDLSSSFGQTRSPIKKEVQQALIESLNESLGLMEESKWNQSGFELRTPESQSNKFRRAVEAVVGARGADYVSPTMTTQEPIIPPITAQAPRQISPQFAAAVKQVIAQSPRQISPQFAAAVEQVIAQSPRQISPQFAAAVKQVIAQSPRQTSPQFAAAVKQVIAQSPRQISPQVATAIKQVTSQIPQQPQSRLRPPGGFGFKNPLKKYAAAGAATAPTASRIATVQPQTSRIPPPGGSWKSKLPTPNAIPTVGQAGAVAAAIEKATANVQPQRRGLRAPGDFWKPKSSGQKTTDQVGAEAAAIIEKATSQLNELLQPERRGLRPPSGSLKPKSSGLTKKQVIEQAGANAVEQATSVLHPRTPPDEHRSRLGLPPSRNMLSSPIEDFEALEEAILQGTYTSPNVPQPLQISPARSQSPNPLTQNVMANAIEQATYPVLPPGTPPEEYMRRLGVPPLPQMSSSPIENFEALESAILQGAYTSPYSPLSAVDQGRIKTEVLTQPSQSTSPAQQSLNESLGLLQGNRYDTSFDLRRSPVRATQPSWGLSPAQQSLNESLGLLQENRFDTSFDLRRSPVRATQPSRGLSPAQQSLNESLGLLQGNRFDTSFDLRRSPVRATQPSRGISPAQQSLNESLGLLQGNRFDTSFDLRRSPVRATQPSRGISPAQQSLNESLGLLRGNRFDTSFDLRRSPVRATQPSRGISPAQQSLNESLGLLRGNRFDTSFDLRRSPVRATQPSWSYSPGQQSLNESLGLLQGNRFDTSFDSPVGAGMIVRQSTPVNRNIRAALGMPGYRSPTSSYRTLDDSMGLLGEEKFDFDFDPTYL